MKQQRVLAIAGVLATVESVLLRRRAGAPVIPRPSARALPAFALTLLVGCTMPGEAVQPMVAGQPAAVEGRVASVDSSAMAYDGDALVMLESDSRGAVTVHVPARTNLCRAQGLGILGDLRAGDRLRVEGTFSGPRDITVCEKASHRLELLD
ncbi:MAG: hypothetical protein M3Q42_13465 [Pseudomonadota bacterium]|nr:hypothetical protein [Pseudomonadota bacterium]